MSDFLSRIAARAVGATPSLSPRPQAMFEPDPLVAETSAQETGRALMPPPHQASWQPPRQTAPAPTPAAPMAWRQEAPVPPPAVATAAENLWVSTEIASLAPNPILEPSALRVFPSEPYAAIELPQLAAAPHFAPLPPEGALSTGPVRSVPEAARPQGPVPAAPAAPTGAALPAANPAPPAPEILAVTVEEDAPTPRTAATSAVPVSDVRPMLPRNGLYIPASEASTRRDAHTAAESPVIEVRIGRIELQVPPPRPASAPRPGPSLNAFLGRKAR
jgi:hypothetical protein